MSDAVVALFVADPSARFFAGSEALSELYQLTHSEAELVRLLASGLSLEEAADKRGVSLNTARSHLKHVFAKTDTSRQGELVRLIVSGVGQIREYARPLARSPPSARRRASRARSAARRHSRRAAAAATPSRGRASRPTSARCSCATRALPRSRRAPRSRARCRARFRAGRAPPARAADAAPWRRQRSRERLRRSRAARAPRARAAPESSSSARAPGTATRSRPANWPARCAIRLSSQLAPWSATVLASASTRPGRSGPITVRTREVTAIATNHASRDPCGGSAPSLIQMGEECTSPNSLLWRTAECWYLPNLMPATKVEGGVTAAPQARRCRRRGSRNGPGLATRQPNEALAATVV